VHRTPLSVGTRTRIVELLKRSTLTRSQIARQFHVSPNTVQAIADENGIPRARHPWTDKEIAFLKENYMEMGAAGIADVMPTHPSRQVISVKARQLGLKTKVGPYGKKRMVVPDGKDEA